MQEIPFISTCMCLLSDKSCVFITCHSLWNQQIYFLLLLTFIFIDIHWYCNVSFCDAHSFEETIYLHSDFKQITNACSFHLSRVLIKLTSMMLNSAAVFFPPLSCHQPNTHACLWEAAITLYFLSLQHQYFTRGKVWLPEPHISSPGVARVQQRYEI